MKSYERVDTDYYTATRVTDRAVIDDDQKKQIRFRRRNYMTTSFIAPADVSHQYGVYSLQFNNQGGCQPCQPCPQPAYQPMMMPMIIPYPCPQQEKECACDEADQLKEEIQFLRTRVAELLSREPEVRYVKETVQDNSKVQELEMENQRLRLNLGQEQSKLRGKDEEIYELKQRLLRLESQGDSKLSDLNARLRDYENQLNMLRSELRGKQQECDEWEQKYREMESTGFIEIEEKVTKLSSEVDVWKNRFKKLNSEFFQTQEQLIMVQAELDSIKNGGVKEVKEVKVEKKVIPTTSTYTTSKVEVTGVSGQSYQAVGGQRGSRVAESSSSFYKEGGIQKLYP